MGAVSSMRRAAAYQLVSKFSSIAVQLVVTAVLARLISPEAFGLVAIVTVFTSFFSMLADMGVGTAVIQFRDLTERDLGGLFFFSGLLGIALMCVFCSLSFLISWFYGEGDLIALCCASSPALLLSALNMVPNGVLLRERRFDSIGIRLIVGNVVSGAIAIALAYFGAGPFALVAQTVATALVVLAWNLITHPLREVNFRFMAPLRRVFSYSAWQFGFSFINFFSSNLDSLVIGRAMGSVSLAYYDKAYKLATYPVTMLGSIINPIIQPFMAIHRDDVDRLYDCWRRISKAFTLMGAPVMAVFICCSTEITVLFYGDQWLESAPLLLALSASLYARVWVNTSGAFFQSAGRTDIMFKAGVLGTLLNAAGLVVGVMAGQLFYVAVGISVARIVNVWFVYRMLLKGLFNKGPRAMVDFVPELICAVVAITLCCVAAPLFEQFGYVVSLILKVSLMLLVMLAGYYITGQLRQLKFIFSR